MPEPLTDAAQRARFAECVALLGGTTAAARRIGIAERTVRRFITGELRLRPEMLEQTAVAMRALIAAAKAAELRITPAFRANLTAAQWPGGGDGGV